MKDENKFAVVPTLKFITGAMRARADMVVLKSERAAICYRIEEDECRCGQRAPHDIWQKTR